MSTGGIFTIIANDGKQDRMLLASQLLHDRLRKINLQKQQQFGGAADDLKNLPTLLDIEKTHILFTNAHFKPFAAIGFEYNKVRANAGNPAVGNTVQFSIPQFGDFFHDVTVHAVLTQPTLTPSGSPSDSDSPLMRWCNYVGERLLEKVQQEVNGNMLDEYTFHSTNFHRVFCVSPGKAKAWDRCVGQEVPEEGFVDQPNWSYNNIAPSAITSRVAQKVHTGAQTPSGQKVGNLELFIPLLFWYNTDIRLAVPSVAIPFGQRFIHLTLASVNKLVDVYARGDSTWASPAGSVVETNPLLNSIELYINNIFVNPEVHKIYIKRVGFSLIRVHKEQTTSCTSSSGEVLMNQLKWPVEYLFLGMKVKSYFNSSTAATVRQNLDKWHLFSSVSSGAYTTQGQNVMKMQKVSTVDDVFVTALGAIDSTSGTTKSTVAIAVGDTLMISGVFFNATSAIVADTEAVDANTVEPAPAVAITPGAMYKVTRQGLAVTTNVCAPTIDTITVKCQGISMYDAIPDTFFNAYVPYHYGGPNINAPDDCGALMIPFCLYPGTYQPSGHINVSRAREFYINYTSSVIDNSTEGTLVVSAKCINFLLITDGSAVLRYST